MAYAMNSKMFHNEEAIAFMLSSNFRWQMQSHSSTTFLLRERTSRTNVSCKY